MWGVAIAFIIIGSAQYRFRESLKIPFHAESERIGRTFWWVGWGMLLWWITASILAVPEMVRVIIASIGTVLLCIRAIKLANQLINLSKDC